MTNIKEFLFDLNFLAIAAVVSAFVISTRFYLYPIIINVSRTKGLMDAPGERKMHKNQVPTLGGLGLFIVFSLSIIIFGLLADLIQPDLIKLLALLGSTIILVFLGVKDDLVFMSPKKKFLGQLIAVLNVVILTDIRVTSLEGLLGVGELPYIASVLFSIFVFVLVINALNLIDGIDGLAASIAVIASFTFGFLFLANGHYMMTLISAILIGALFGFLRYNLSKSQKIFMGDCGSMLMGFLLAYQGISFLALNATTVSDGAILNAPIVLLAALSYPLFDLLRVFAIRIKQKRSPFDADSNHIHHRLLRLGLNHKRATLLLCMCNAFVIGFTFLLTEFNIHVQLLITVCVGSLLYLLPFLKVFETNKELGNEEKPLPKETPKKQEVVQAIPTQQFAVNDTFEFDLKPIDFLEHDAVAKKGVISISTSKDYIKLRPVTDKDRKVATEAKKKLVVTDEAKGRLLSKRSASLKKVAQKR